MIHRAPNAALITSVQISIESPDSSDQLLIEGTLHRTNGNIITYFSGPIPNDINITYDKSTGILQAIIDPNAQQQLHDDAIWQCIINKTQFYHNTIHDTSDSTPITRNIIISIDDFAHTITMNIT